MGDRVATTVWKIDAQLVLQLDERLGQPVDSYVNGSQTWLVDVGEPGRDESAPTGWEGSVESTPGRDDLTLEWRLHPVAGYLTPHPLSHYDVWEATVDALTNGADPHALHLGDETRPLTSLWDGLECFAAYGDEVEPQRLAALATERLGRAPDGVGLVDHESIADAWEAAHGKVSIVALLLEQLST
jgi:hypothetical protein